MGYDVVALGHNGEEAVELYGKHKPDLITLDITMPVKDGQEALNEIMASDPDAKVVMMSAVRGETMMDCLRVGASGFIEKPLKFNDGEFVENVKDVLEDALDN
jgi:two-component system, chemotaxis family, chemotaxis protein CheY